ncbi:MAG: histidine phosphatase family protein [Flavobacteriaceae bacterium]|nr:histidine phosphatase family protein [Flavobacteriaceae bacterium]
MKKIPLLLLVICFSFTGSQIQPEAVIQEKTTYYFVRHAEKVVSKTNRDPELQPKGELRAHKWARVLKNIKLDAVYSTNYKRTMATAQPTAESKGLSITIYHPTEIDYEQFKKDTKGKSVLVVGHSNTIPGFVNKMIGKDNLYIVELVDNMISDQVLYID